MFDDFQVRAFDAIDSGHSVLVAAPTGSGKTLVAQYAIERALGAGGKVFYTTPIKALSNQKHRDLGTQLGVQSVGLLTGDVALQGDAQVVVMTTEVLRNMIYARSPLLAGLSVVVLDEVHYLQDRYRGAVWEEVILHLDPRVSLVCLSATVSNAEDLADWLSSVRGRTDAIIEERRPVDLTHLYMVGDRDSEQPHLMPTFTDGASGTPNPEILRLEGRYRDRYSQTSGGRGRRGGDLRSSLNRGAARGGARLCAPRRFQVVERLAAAQMLPAIVFVFSRAGCDQAVDQCVAAGLRLTTESEAAAIAEIAERHVVGLCDEDLAALEYPFWIEALERGIGAHHAGLVPAMKEAVEEAFAEGLVKVVFATETLALGINMPARSVVIEKLTKFNGDGHVMLTPGEYTQLTGRAGRRGIDTAGYAVVCWNKFVAFDQVAGLASRRSFALKSAFRPTYNMTANLVSRCSPADAHRILNQSFAQFEVGRASTNRGSKVSGRRESMSVRFDRVLALLGEWGYVVGWQLTTVGHLLGGLFTESDLLVTEALRRGLFDNLTARELAALVSCFTYEHRGRDATSGGKWPNKTLRTRFEDAERIWQELAACEKDAGLAVTNQPDSGLMAGVYSWASGSGLGQVLEETNLGAGDFVRGVRRCVDLLGQLGDLSAGSDLSTVARDAVGACNRGVVATSPEALEVPR